MELLLAFVILPLLFGIFSGLIASSRNRSGFGWFLVGFFFGPFGLLVTAFPIPPDKERFAKRVPNHLLADGE